jgi:pilus assembly protein CpaE
MGHGVQFIILNSDEAFGKQLRTTLHRMDNVRIVAEVGEIALVRQAVDQFPADVLLVNLDPAPEAVLPIAGEIASANPRLAVFAVSESKDSELILKVLRTGLREFLTKPIDVSALSEAIERVASTKVDTVSRGRLITVTGAAGGTGATTLATNLAVELAQLAEGRVTVVDLDYRCGQVATFLDIDATYSLADLAQAAEHVEQQMIERTLVKHASGVQVLSRPATFEQADTITASACVGVLSSLLQCNEYVVTDGPSRFDPRGQSVYDFSDMNLLLVQLLVPSVRSALRTVEALREAGANLERWRLICNRIGLESVHLSVADAVETIGLPSFASLPDDWPTVSGAINLGEPLLSHGPKSKIRTAIADLASRLHKPQAGGDDADTHKKGLIGRIFAGSS